MWNDILSGIEEDYRKQTKSSVETVDGEPVSSPVRNVDADTLAVGDQRYRLEGFNAPETAKFQGGVFVPGQRAGDRTQENVNRVAQMGGYTNLKSAGKTDPYGRTVADQQDQTGNSLGDMVTALGLTEINRYSNLDAVKEQGLVSAMSRIMPSMKDADPMIRLAAEEHTRTASIGRARSILQPGSAKFGPGFSMYWDLPPHIGSVPDRFAQRCC